MPRTPPSIVGPDVSSHQSPALVPWDALRAIGKASFMFARTGFGVASDATFPEHVRRARGAGVDLVGGYHAARPMRPVAAQVDILERQAEAVGGEVVPVLDLEVMDDRGPNEVAYFALAFVAEVERRFGVPCVFYTYPFYALGLPLPPELATRPLWIAHYLAITPRIPAPWTDWAIHQYDGDGGEKAPGGMDLDFNRFRYHSTVDDLRKALRGPVSAIPDTLPAPVHDEALGVCLPPPLACVATP